MPNFAGNRAYTLLVNATPMIDSGVVVKVKMSGIARGNTTADFNVKLRGAGKRIDKLPDRPYP